MECTEQWLMNLLCVARPRTQYSDVCWKWHSSGYGISDAAVCGVREKLCEQVSGVEY